MEPRKMGDYPENLTPEHDKRGAANEGFGNYGPLHPDVVAAYDYVDAVLPASDYIDPPAWHGWAIREAFLAGISHAENKTQSKGRRSHSHL